MRQPLCLLTITVAAACGAVACDGWKGTSDTADEKEGTPQAPTIVEISNQRMAQDSSLTGLPLTIGDPDSVVTCDGVTAVSSNTTLLPVEKIVIGGTAPNCTLSLTPAQGESGRTMILLALSDGNFLTSKAFELEVTEGF